MKLRLIKEIFVRYVVLTIGLFILAFGIALSVKADLGVSPISCPVYVLSLFLPITLGQLTFMMLGLFILAQIVILKKEYDPLQLTQVIVAIIFGGMLDLTLFILRDFYVESYILRVIVCFLSFVFLGLGIAIEVCANVSMLAGDGLVKAISHKTGIGFGKMKIIFDCSLVAAALIIGLIHFHKIIGIREGTLGAAIFTGLIINFIYNIPFFKKYAPKQ